MKSRIRTLRFHRMSMMAILAIVWLLAPLLAGCAIPGQQVVIVTATSTQAQSQQVVVVTATSTQAQSQQVVVVTATFAPAPPADTQAPAAPTAYPTYTPYPTYTTLPPTDTAPPATYTPYPTYTPFPTYTPVPATRTPKPPANTPKPNPTNPPANYPPPALMAPPDGFNCYNQRGQGCDFSWSWGMALKANEYFQVQLVGPNNEHRGIHPPTKTYSFHSSNEVFLIIPDWCNVDYYCHIKWTVAIIEWNGVDPSKIGRTITEAAARNIIL